MKNIFKLLAANLAIFIAVLPLFCGNFLVKAEVFTEYSHKDLLTGIPASAEVKSTSELKITAKSAILMEPNTKKILYAINPDEKLAPASITKIMSLILVMEAIESKKITTETKVTTSEHAAKMGGSQIWLEVGETMTVDELLRASVIASANDATVALAEAVAGSEETFVKLMNEKAQSLGMTGTVFKNACGLDEDGHLTTGRDVAIMASELIKHDLIKKYSTVWLDALRDGKSELANTNKLVRYYKGATGLKTGTTSSAGCCVAATAERDGLELVAVIMGSDTSKERFAGASKLLDFGFANWSFTKLTPNLKDVEKIPVLKGLKNFVTADCSGKWVDLLIDKGSADKITQTIEIKENITAPILAGDIIGNVTFSLNGKKVGEVPILAAEEVKELDFFNSLTTLLYTAIKP